MTQLLPLASPGTPRQSVAFGMGGGLLQRLNRDTLSLATKLSHIVYADGTGGWLGGGSAERGRS